jgi:hypothetical protein
MSKDYDHKDINNLYPYFPFKTASVVKWLALVLRIREVPWSILRSEACYAVVVFLSSSGKLATAASRHILTISLFTVTFPVKDM